MLATAISVEEPVGGLPAWAPRPQRLATAVVSDLVGRIVAGEFAPGFLFPPEPVLCDRFSVSRTTIREAVKALESMRLAEVRRGSGTWVRPAGEWNLLDPTVLAARVAHGGRAVADEIVALRRELEGAMAGRAAVLLDGERNASLAAIVEQLDACDDPSRHLRLRVAFHEMIMGVSASPLSRAVITVLNTQGIGGPCIEPVTADDRQKSNTEHHQIFQALVGRDADEARHAMSEHIHQSWLRNHPPEDPGLGRR